MNVLTVTVLFVFQLIHQAQFILFDRNDSDTWNDIIDDDPENEIKLKFVNGSELTFFYWNSNLGNDKPIDIAFDKVSSVLDYWIDGLPLKVITHGWLASDDDFTGVFCIKTAYVDTGGFNIITVDWSHIAEDIIYSRPAVLTLSVGYVIAEFFENLVAHTGTHPSDIHLLGHSLGAHVMGSCGYYFKSGKIGRITGLDPACPGFQFIPLQKQHLNKDDGKFVDVIHTSAGTLGYMNSLGHVDFYPNGGIAPQPGCSILKLKLLICSHSRAYELYADSVYNRKSLIATQCNSWLDFITNKCENNTKIMMGHDAEENINARGDFYLKTSQSKPFSIL
ncbi:lipase member H-B-like [Melanaphis sacchari]|uniref:lipase member H-B-like n=1 Tax=Melanaphis sacchari TaxID=742174 RepID=UPI000DC1599A|nr:lipase member H-B-like [Melanaphis sacchari]